MPTLTERQVKDQQAQAHLEQWTGPDASLPPGSTFGSTGQNPLSRRADMTEQQVRQMLDKQDGPDHHLWD